MQNILENINGKKTYIVSGVSVVLGVINLLAGKQYAQIVPYLLAGAFGGSLRHAIAKVTTKAEEVLPAPVAQVVKPVVIEEEVKAEQPEAQV